MRKRRTCEILGITVRISDDNLPRNIIAIRKLQKIGTKNSDIQKLYDRQLILDKQ